MDYDFLVSEAANSSKKQTFSHINDFCNPRQITVKDVYNMITLNELQYTNLKIITPPIKCLGTPRFRSFFLPSSEEENVIGFGLLGNQPIIETFGPKDIIHIENDSILFHSVIKKEDKVKWARYDCGLVLTTFKTNDKKQIGIIIFRGDYLSEKHSQIDVCRLFQNDESVKFYDLGA
jgi:hypothetical protein